MLFQCKNKFPPLLSHDLEYTPIVLILPVVSVSVMTVPAGPVAGACRSAHINSWCWCVGSLGDAEVYPDLLTVQL